MFKSQGWEVVIVESAYSFKQLFAQKHPIFSTKSLKTRKILQSLADWVNWSLHLDPQELALYLDSKNPKGHIWLVNIRSE